MENQVEVVVIGAGLAGLSAANKVAQEGMRVLVLEKSHEDAYLCNSRYTGGLFHIAMDDMAGDPNWVKSNIERVTHGTTEPALAEALSQNARRTLRWLSSLGVRFIKAGPDGLRQNALSPPGVRQTGLNWKGRAGDVMLRTLENSLTHFGGKLARGQEVVGLLMEQGRCVGVKVRQLTGELDIRANAVVIADGGFQGNEALLKRFVCSAPEKLLQRNAQTGMGAGLLMAEAVGAKLVGTENFYGHLQHRQAMTDGALWPYPVVDSLATASAVINGEGQRFCDEGLGGVFVTNAVAKLSDPLSAMIIFDEAIWQGPGKDWLLPANPYLLHAGGSLISAPTLTELAVKLGLEPAVLEKTIHSYNTMITTGQQGDQPHRTTANYRAWPIQQGPFYALEMCAGITYTMGGIATNAKGQILTSADQPIEGLYAAGACTGGLEGTGGSAGYSGGLSKSSVFGMLVGESIVASR